jgi:hypothetical protein
MAKQPISVTLDRDNLLWLRGRVAAGKRKSVSEALDEILTAARLGGSFGEARSVVGTIDIAAEDPDLAHADGHISALFSASLKRPAVVPEARAKTGGRRKPRHG